MSDYIPFEIQSEIIKKLPVKSIVQFRSVSREWKSFIDNPGFIKTYHINHPNPRHHLLARYKTDSVTTYTSIIDDNTFPQQKFPVTAPEPFNLISRPTMLGSVDGLLYFYGSYYDGGLETKMVVLWNPSIRKRVGIPIPDDTLYTYTRAAFGVCPQTNDPKLVKIKVDQTSWDVQVFTLSSSVWKTVYKGVPSKSCHLKWVHVFIDGIIYWRSSGSFIISFDLKTEKIGELRLPERLQLPTNDLSVAKVKEYLGLLEYYIEGGMWVCGVWMTKDGVNKPFTKIYTIKGEGNSVFRRVLWFRNNGEVVVEMGDDYFEKSQIGVYEPSSGRIKTVGIGGEYRSFSAWSYMESLLLLDGSNSIIH